MIMKAYSGPNPFKKESFVRFLVEIKRFELLASCVQGRRSPS